MLLNTVNETIYDPTVHLTQAELMEKFNLAFYEGQNSAKSTTLDQVEIEDDYLIDYLISGDGNEEEFDFNDFVQTFDENLSTETSTTGSSGNICDFFENQTLDLDDIDLSDTLSDLDNFTNDLQDLDEVTFENGELLPPISTIHRTLDFSSYLRSIPDDSLLFDNPQQHQGNEFGHLLGGHGDTLELEENQLVLPQNEALLDLNEDPLLSSSSLMYRHRTDSDEEVSSSTVLQCQWENCYQIYDCQTALVKHIEKSHVEVKRGDEFTCFWAGCPRKVKPFNARYKLLIHMRVHSGEKPNKCPFEGCNKAFSRLENLKIHQRSHTGERPYLCQFPTCTKSFSNSSDRAKHQRTHFDTKPYACQVVGCTKKYTDPSSLRKHVKNHTSEEQMLIKSRKGQEECFSSSYTRKFFDPNRQKAVKSASFYTSVEHNYSTDADERKYDSVNIRQDLKNKISEKRLRKAY